ncbi:MAG: response regulator [Rhodoferax sp.]|nr:response regulator [Rhodoferax sp.]MDP3652818.1 response regulator [Rhodoferax sp.]
MMKGILLCVDDEMVVLVALKEQLWNAFGDQHIIEVAQSGEEGLEILDDLTGDGYMPLVIISDWLMPGMKGDEFLIEAHKRFPYVVTVMLSGQADEASVKRVRQEAQLHEFIAKPWDGDTLIRCVREGLAHYRAPIPTEVPR